MVPAVSVPIARAHALRGGEEEAVVPAVGVLIARAHALRERAAEEATEGRTKPRRSPTTFTRVSASFVFSPTVGLRPFISLLCCASYIRIAAAPRQALDDEKHCRSTRESLSPLQYVSKSSFRLFVYSCFYFCFPISPSLGLETRASRISCGCGSRVGCSKQANA